MKIKTNKFNAVKCEFNGEIFDSKKELAYYKKLLLLKSATNPSERITDIERQKRYDLIINGKNCGFYKLDFLITYADGKQRCVDVKGLKIGASYQIFRLKSKIVNALYGITIEEI